MVLSSLARTFCVKRIVSGGFVDESILGMQLTDDELPFLHCTCLYTLDVV